MAARNEVVAISARDTDSMPVRVRMWVDTDVVGTVVEVMQAPDYDGDRRNGTRPAWLLAVDEGVVAIDPPRYVSFGLTALRNQLESLKLVIGDRVRITEDGDEAVPRDDDAATTLQ